MKIVYGIMALLTTLLLMLILICLSGCSTSYKLERDIKKQHQLNYEHPDQLAADCAKWFPNIDSVGKVKPAVNVNFSGTVDSLKRIIDSLANSKPVTKKDSADFKQTLSRVKNKVDDLASKYKPCKPDTQKIFVTNSAALNNADNKYKGKSDSLILVRANLSQSRGENKTLLYWVIGLAAALTVTWALKIYGWISGFSFLSLFKKL